MRGGEVESERADTPVLITDAARSYDEDLAARKRKYLTMMLVRVACLLVAGLVSGTWWLAVLFALLSIPLPWIAVLVANDQAPREVENVNRYRASQREIEARDHPVIDERP
jgi:hypothetical protein